MSSGELQDLSEEMLMTRHLFEPELQADYKELWTGYKGLYAELAKRNMVGLKKID